MHTHNDGEQHLSDKSFCARNPIGHIQMSEINSTNKVAAPRIQFGFDE